MAEENQVAVVDHRVVELGCRFTNLVAQYGELLGEVSGLKAVYVKEGRGPATAEQFLDDGKGLEPVPDWVHLEKLWGLMGCSVFEDAYTQTPCAFYASLEDEIEEVSSARFKLEQAREAELKAQRLAEAKREIEAVYGAERTKPLPPPVNGFQFLTDALREVARLGMDDVSVAQAVELVQQLAADLQADDVQVGGAA